MTALPLPAAAALAFLAINILTLVSFWLDKRAARRGMRRTSEATLLTLALAGGTPGAYWARNVFRHKTRKQPFTVRLHAITAVQVAAIVSAIAWHFSG